MNDSLQIRRPDPQSIQSARRETAPLRDENADFDAASDIDPRVRKPGRDRPRRDKLYSEHQRAPSERRHRHKHSDFHSDSMPPPPRPPKLASHYRY